jgi:hypothetical protein
MKILVHTEISRPVSVVFDQIADNRNEAQWNTQVSAIDLVSEEPIQKGSRFKVVNHGNVLDLVLSKYNKPQSLSFDGTSKAMDIHADVTFKTLDANTTHVSAEYTITPNGFMKVVMPLIAPMLRKQFTKEFENFKHFSESKR